MNWLIRACVAIDVVVLLAVKVFRGFCLEWFSWGARSMERGAAITYSFLMSAGVIPHRLMALYLLAYGPIGFYLWLESRRSDEKRIQKLFYFGYMPFRVGCLALVPFMATLMIRGPHHWTDALPVVGQAAYAYVHFSTSLPVDGEPGRRRKLALAKIKEMFGTSWMPVPERG